MLALTAVNRPCYTRNVAKAIRFTSYARTKFVFLREHGFQLNQDAVLKTILEPEAVSRSHLGRWVAQRQLNDRHLLRVIYEEWPHERLVITFYPARRSRYESTHEV